MPKLNYFKDTFQYFKRFKNSISEGTVLDYGSNYGTFLDSSKGKFPEENYTGIDVDNEALDAGRLQFPKAKFIWYNGYNPIYNSSGIEEKFDFNQQFDTIISYSVFTHTSKEDMCNKIDWLYLYLKPGGSILATWLDVDTDIPVNYFFNKRVKDYGYCEKIETDDYIYLLDNKCSKVIKPNIKLLLAFYNKTYLKKIMSKYNPFLFNAFPDIPTCFQSCMIIVKPE